MEQATLSAEDTSQITQIAQASIRRLGCFSSQVKNIGVPYEGGYHVTLIGTISGQLLELQALVVHERRNQYSCANCWVSRHA